MLYEQIEIGGSDAVAFLQGQLTQDVALLAAGVSLPAAWCNPKGRVVATTRLIALDTAIGMLVAAPLATAIEQRLSMYRFRSDVTITRSTGDWQASAVADAQSFADLAAADLLPAPGMACRNHGLVTVDYSAADRFVEIFGSAGAMRDAGMAADSALSHSAWCSMRIRAGLADIGIESSEKYTPHMLNLDRVSAISFSKGCYTGQEVVARTQNLGESKRRTMRYRCDTQAVAVGDKLSSGDREVGTVVNAAGSEILAVTPVALHEQPLTVAGGTATPAGLPYDL